MSVKKRRKGPKEVTGAKVGDRVFTISIFVALEMATI